MKMKTADPTPRPYRQTARAAAAAATHRRIVEAFLAFARDRWFDEIILDDVAREAGVTVQTVIRRFGGKEGLLNAASDLLADDISARRAVSSGAIDTALKALVDDYEVTGDLVIHLLAQEPRYPVLQRLLVIGRAYHRAWIADIFRSHLAGLTATVREHHIDTLVVATDVYAWKLLRRDMGRSPKAVAVAMRQLVSGLVLDTSPNPV